MYNLKWSEDVAPGYFMGKIEVTDMDENAKQLFSLDGADAEYFWNSGVLKTSLPLDREKVSKYTLRAHAQDACVAEWECVSEVNIEVTDVNDNKPEFSQSVFTASMPEDTPSGAIAIKIHATDADGLPANKKLNYAIVHDAFDERLFTIDPDSGIVRLAKSLDQETQAMYNLTIPATDQGRSRSVQDWHESWSH